MDIRIYPKVNIFLKILGRDNQGYHQISSRFYLAHGVLYDEMRIEPSSHFRLVGDFGCEERDNLIYKATQILSEYVKGTKGAQSSEAKALKSLKIEVAKHIPKGAGLGGGSANAGVFLRAVNDMLELGLSDELLSGLGGKIGSDVAFFASGVRSANVSGRGECVEAFDEGLDSEMGEIEIFTPDIFCDTRAVYGEYARFITEGGSYSAMPTEWLNQPSNQILKIANTTELNDLYMPSVRLYPQLSEVRRDLGDGWCFSGSGSSFFRFKMP